MPTITTGRVLDQRGHPIVGTGFEFVPDDHLADLLRQRNSPLISQPTTGEWIFGLVTAADTDGDYERGVGIFPPGNSGPLEHFHPTYDEHFEIIAGSFVFTVDGQAQTVAAGAQLIVPQGTPHTFRCVGNTYGAAIVETHPAARIGEVIYTLFGMAHDDKLTASGQPQLLQAMVIADEYRDDTVFTTPPPGVVLMMATVLAPIARVLGYRPTNPQYLDDSFWEAHVEQPDI